MAQKISLDREISVSYNKKKSSSPNNAMSMVGFTTVNKFKTRMKGGLEFLVKVSRVDCQERD